MEQKKLGKQKIRKKITKSKKKGERLQANSVREREETRNDKNKRNGELKKDKCKNHR